MFCIFKLKNSPEVFHVSLSDSQPQNSFVLFVGFLKSQFQSAHGSCSTLVSSPVPDMSGNCHIRMAPSDPALTICCCRGQMRIFTMLELWPPPTWVTSPSLYFHTYKTKEINIYFSDFTWSDRFAWDLNCISIF